MPESTFRPLAGWRIIADPSALDRAVVGDGDELVRISADDAFVIGAVGNQRPPAVDDSHAIVTPEHGFAGTTLSTAQLTALADAHIEWQLPSARPALAQGQIAGVPAKLILRSDGTALLLVACAARHELEARIS